VACTVADVAAIIRARTKDSNGFEVGTFTGTTRPTDTQCQEAIDHAVVLIHTKVGDVGEGCASLAKGVVALGAAAEIERSYFPEQSRSDRSIYTFLVAEYDKALDGLVNCVSGDLPGSLDVDGEYDDGYGYGSLQCVSGTVYSYYTGTSWPAIPEVDVPVVQPVSDNGE
jgi:hypothetical protein